MAEQSEPLPVVLASDMVSGLSISDLVHGYWPVRAAKDGGSSRAPAYT